MKPRMKPWKVVILIMVIVAVGTAAFGVAVAAVREWLTEDPPQWQPTPDLSTVRADKCYIAIDGDLRCRLTPTPEGGGKVEP